LWCKFIWNYKFIIKTDPQIPLNSENSKEFVSKGTQNGRKSENVDLHLNMQILSEL
jgi:hypothetical protein